MTVFWTDAPITSKAEDEFDRTDYATHAAQLIDSAHSWDDSTVFALTGPWGSGKTSMLSMIEEELRTNHEQWRVARFTPWATGDVTGLLEDFYASLSQALPAKKGRHARAALSTLARTTAPAAKAIPYAGESITEAVLHGGNLLNQRKPWNAAFDDARVRLRAINRPVLVIADDVDRLQSDELLTLLKVVRLLGRFPGVHYLLAYDAATLFRTLEGTDSVAQETGAGQRFMEKIVQYPLIVPALTTRQLLLRVENGIANIMRDANRTRTQQDPFTDRLSGLEDLFRTLLPTPRAVDRYLAQLRHHLPLLATGEAHDDDIIVLTLLRVSLPLLYDQLQWWRDELTSGHTGEMVDPPDQDWTFKPFSIQPLLQTVPEAQHEPAQRLLRDLFPALPTPGPDFAPPNRPKGISDASYFDRYFTLTIPQHDIADHTITELVTKAAQDPTPLIELLRIGDPERAALAVDKATAYLHEHGEDDATRIPILQSLIPSLDNWTNDGRLFTSPRSKIENWITQLLNGLSPKIDPQPLIAALDRTSSIYDRSAIVLRAARSDAGKHDWFNPIVTTTAELVTQEFIHHLTQRDDATPGTESAWMITFLSELNQGPLVSAQLSTGIQENLFTIEDIAARFVLVDTTFDEPRLDQIRRDDFETLAPRDEDNWYQRPLQEVDTSDLSWPNRRAAATGRLARPRPYETATGTNPPTA